MVLKSSGYAIRAVAYLVAKSGEGRKIGIQEIAEDLVVP
jgi:DNA-binding IscR family transcriptional regulator